VTYNRCGDGRLRKTNSNKYARLSSLFLVLDNFQVEGDSLHSEIEPYNLSVRQFHGRFTISPDASIRTPAISASLLPRTRRSYPNFKDSTGDMIGGFGGAIA
jgi:hypothetical protein